MNKTDFYKGLLLLLTSAGLLAACGNDEEAQESASTEDTTQEATLTEDDIPEEPESLHMWVNAEDAQVEAYEEITDNFTEETGIEVELTTYDMLDQTEGISLDGPSG